MWLMDDASQIQMCWRRGSRLALIPRVDSFRDIGTYRARGTHI